MRLRGKVSMKRDPVARLLALGALLVAVLGATPLGSAVAGAASSVLFAQNAGAVNGIHAARKPTPGKLLPLDKNGKLPASVVRQGPQGRPGPQGAQGRQGSVGPIGPAGTGGSVDVVTRSVQSQVTLPAYTGAAWGPATAVLTVPLPGGRWVVFANWTALDYLAGAADDTIRCSINVGGADGGDARNDLRPTVAIYQQAGSAVASADSATATTASLNCQHQAPANPVASVFHPTITAIRVGMLDKSSAP
jgi:hypothetical protein